LLATFDLGVDVFGLLSGNFRINLPGKFSVRVAALEVVVPDVVQINAEGIDIHYDPANKRPDQELVRIDNATILFPKFGITGSISPFDPTPGVPGDEIPGLIVRSNGFTLGTAQIKYKPGAPTNTGTQ